MAVSVILNNTDLRIMMDLVQDERVRLAGGICPPMNNDTDLDSLYEKLIDIAYLVEDDEDGRR